MLLKKAAKWCTQTLTVILVPHFKGKTYRIRIPLSLIYLILIFWFGSLAWSTLIISKKIDYQETLQAYKTLKHKTEYFAGLIDKNRDLLEEVKKIDTKLRGLLSMKTKENIIEFSGVGGPSTQDHVAINLMLEDGSGSQHEQVFKMNVDELKLEAWQRKQSYSEINNFLEEQQSLLLSTPCIWPTSGYLSSRFGYRNSPFTGRIEFHRGSDIACKEGTPIRATADGKVILAGWEGGYGKIVMISHGNGYSTRYAHNSQILVKVRDRVKRGQVIALAGATGRSTGIHLHYEVRRYGKPVNPLRYVRKRQ